MKEYYMKITLRYFRKALGGRRQFFGPIQLIILFGINKNFLNGGRSLIFYLIKRSVMESMFCDFGWKTKIQHRQWNVGDC
jgi:hypothetical protein